MTKLVTYYEQAQPIKEYVNEMTTNKDQLLDIYQSFQLPKNDERLDKIKDKNYKVLVITEDWCGDAMMNIPVLLNIADYANIEVKVFHRDEDTNLIDQYLTNGTARSIPIFVFLNENHEQEHVWGPRAISVQKHVEILRKDLPSKDDSTYAEKEKEVHHQIHEAYQNNTQFWDDVYESIVSSIA
ncbi:thioredoxin family protein [Mammaliicoccus vitulinus]|uniref:Thioredoxin family protein n=1 Tax=Mammaliicoccus vitulinus TaxID=71237 RepID=A0A2T4PU84_9STAP|nr:thioredoxin family protein [Mammaliicoccus vitulinus]HAL09814.1 thioredoxin family protein [Staphylococcus sp.]MBM6629972.1 thioredoxin family protein [Mammaliicoccus vitulinus]MBO3077887.1 thioredoxin family protein [Mammaliicoccus vitulinus]MEB7658193.1 thioredoxin family protein [Mammaliicoccus vitulinus]PNZ39403.1 thioredoxin family protein [Mammaliicoccus vitulinus]